MFNDLASARGVAKIKSPPRGGRIELVQRVAILRATPISKKVIPVRKGMEKKRSGGTVARLAIPVRRSVAKKRVPPARPSRPSPIRDSILKHLAVVSHYEKSGGKRRSVGLLYADVLARVKKDHPHARTDVRDLRVAASMVRQNVSGFACKLPDKRPKRPRLYSTKFTKKGN